MSEISMLKKSFEKVKLVNSLKEAEGAGQCLIEVYRFNTLTILTRFILKDEERLKDILTVKANKGLLKRMAEKKVEVLHLEVKNLSSEFH